MQSYPKQMRSPVVRKPVLRDQAHTGVARFIPTLTILVTLVALAPLAGVGQPFGQASHLGNRLRTKGQVSGSSQLSSSLFLPAVNYNSGGDSPISVAIADMNGDGNPDLVVANSGANTVGILLGDGNGTFQTAATYDVGGQDPISVAVGNLLQGGDYRWSWRMVAPTKPLVPVPSRVAWLCSLVSSTPRRGPIGRAGVSYSR
jgi:FG-GAP-like repeat